MYLHRKGKITKNKKILTFLLRNGIHINYKNLKKQSYLSYVVKSKNEDYIRTIFGHYMFDTNFILNLLVLSKYKIKASTTVLKKMIDNEFTKVEIYDDLYFLAVEYNTAPVMKTLLEFDIYFNDKICSNKLLILACLVKNLSIIDALVQNGVDINKRSNSFEADSSLMSACKVKAYGHYIPQVNEQNRDDYIYAITKYLVDHGAIINETNKFGYTPLIYASKYNNFKAMKYLIEHGADINAKNNFEYSSLIYLCQHGNLEGIEYLIKQGANIDDRERSGDTSLMIACKNKFDDIVEFLVENHADVNAKNKVVKYLLDHGADITIKNKRGQTPAFFAINSSNKEIVKLLIRRDTDLINNKNELGAQLLLFGVRKGNKDIIIKLLIAYGAELNSQDQNGKTSLIYLCGNKHYFNDAETVKFILDNGADPRIQDHGGKSPLIWASQNKKDKVVEVLIQKGAEVNAQDQFNKTALFYASRRQYHEI
ncbi:ankyrin, partial [Neocallimastix californiae]